MISDPSFLLFVITMILPMFLLAAYIADVMMSKWDDEE